MGLYPQRVLGGGENRVKASASFKGGESGKGVGMGDNGLTAPWAASPVPRRGFSGGPHALAQQCVLSTKLASWGSLKAAIPRGLRVSHPTMLSRGGGVK